jgi:DNA-binding transcriptional LysR family regulator
METMIGMQCFVRSAEAGSFSEAARRLGMTSAAVGKNVARLEAGLGVRLFQRSTRSLTLTEAGESFLHEVKDSLLTIQAAVDNLASAGGQPAGMLKVSMGTGFGRTYMVPLLAPFLAKYPGISPDWHFDNRQIDLIAQGFDAALGGGFELPPGVVARVLAPAHRVLVAAPDYFRDRKAPKSPDDLDAFDGIFIRSPQTGRVRSWPLRNRANRQLPVMLRTRMTMSDPEAACESAQMGLGIALVSVPNALPFLREKSLVRVLPDWYVDGGTLSLYFAAQKLLPAKTRVFVDYVVEHFRQERLAEQFSAI